MFLFLKEHSCETEINIRAQNASGLGARFVMFEGGRRVLLVK